jgi:hypothetical protein
MTRVWGWALHRMTNQLWNMQEMLRIGGGKTLSWQGGIREIMIHHFLPSAFIRAA